MSLVSVPGIPTIPVATAILVHKEGYTTETQ